MRALQWLAASWQRIPEWRLEGAYSVRMDAVEDSKRASQTRRHFGV
jgi:hypothetical protein